MSKKILDTDKQVVNRGLNDKTIKAMNSFLVNDMYKLFVIYATAKEFLDYGLEKFPDSSYLVLWEISESITDEFIIEKQMIIERPMKPWSAVGFIQRGNIK